MSATIAGSISSNNSTTRPLGANATYQGAWEESQSPDVMVTLKCDSDCTLYIEFSTDRGVHADSSLAFSVNSGVGEFHTAVKGTRACRIRIVNGSGAQTYLRVQTEFGLFRQANSPLSGIIQKDADALTVRPSNSSHETALGRRQGVTLWHKFGLNADVGTATPEVVAAFGGTFTPRTTGTTLSVVSNDTNDTNNDTGAHGLVIYGVDANWDSQVEVVFLTGTTPVVTTSSWIGINRVAIYRAGTSLANEGLITVTAVTGGETMATMPVEESTSQQVIFHVPADSQALIDHIEASVIRFGSGTEPLVTFELRVFSAVSNAVYLVGTYYLDASLVNKMTFDPVHPLVVGEKSAIWIKATTTRDSTSVAARMVLTVYQDPDA